jgi:hypothetical protein
MAEKPMVVVENVNVPGYITRVDAGKYNAMREVLLKVLPAGPPGLTQAEMLQAIQPHLPETIWPGGAKAGWWMKSVQLDLEAKGVIKRSTTSKPIRWYRA